MQCYVKLYLGSGGKQGVGPGRIELLRQVRALGSLRKAAASLNISYRWAWGHINEAEAELGCTLLTRIEGGKSGRPLTVTREAEELIDWYEAIERSLNKTLTAETRDKPAFLTRTDAAPAP